jgi:hypothetical protein
MRQCENPIDGTRGGHSANMVDKHVVRVAAILGSAVAIFVGCNGNSVSLDRQKDKVDSGRPPGGDEDAGPSGQGGSTSADAGQGHDSGGTGGNAAGNGGAAGGGVVLGGDGGAAGTQLPNPTNGLKASTKLDLLLMVDNSISMSDKQEVLSRTIPDLVARIADPASGVTDLHLGVITSSIGGHGSNTLCVGNDSGSLTDQEVNDHGWLVGTRPRFTPASAGLPPTPQGFLAWTPDLGTAGLVASTIAMVKGAGEFGCGLESQLEAVYRFLADPHPYQTITQVNCPGSQEQCAVPTGLDTELLAQRKAFLRPDSAVAIIALTDENDCSIRESGQYYYAARDNIILPHGSSACQTNPNDKCCYFCNSAVPAGCAPDPTCSQFTPRDKDQPNLRCFHQLERFGFDFLYPTARYVNAFTKAHLCTSRADLAPLQGNCKDVDGDNQPDLVDNPLLVDPDSGTFRDPSLVYFLGIVGVPYQDLQKAKSATRIDYKSPSELVSAGTWGVVLGDSNPGNYAPPVLPTDALMAESVDPRGGMDGETPPAALAGTEADLLANPVNGHEWVNSDQDDLQYACIFPVATPRNCMDVLNENPSPGCDCKPGLEANHNPLCQDASGYSTVQRYAKAYPSLRELEVIRSLGQNGLASSICARNVTDDSRQDYGYRPAIDLLLTQLGRSVP